MAGKRSKPATAKIIQAAEADADQTKAQQSWDAYVASQLSSGKDAARQAQLVSTLEAQLARPGMTAFCDEHSLHHRTHCIVAAHGLSLGLAHQPDSKACKLMQAAFRHHMQCQCQTAEAFCAFLVCLASYRALLVLALDCIKQSWPDCSQMCTCL